MVVKGHKFNAKKGCGVKEGGVKKDCGVKEGLVFEVQKEGNVLTGCIVSGDTLKHYRWLRTMTARSKGLPKGVKGAEWKPAKGHWVIPTHVWPPYGTPEHSLLSGEEVQEDVKAEVKAEVKPEVKPEVKKSRKGDWMAAMGYRIHKLCTAQRPDTDPLHSSIAREMSLDCLRKGIPKSMMECLGKANGEVPHSLNVRWKEYLDSVFERNPHTCLLYTSPSPRDVEESRMPSSA